jgi:hypothetical protein
VQECNKVLGMDMPSFTRLFKTFLYFLLWARVQHHVCNITCSSVLKVYRYLDICSQFPQGSYHFIFWRTQDYWL